MTLGNFEFPKQFSFSLALGLVAAFIYIPQPLPVIGTIWALFNPIPDGSSYIFINLIFIAVILDVVLGLLSKWVLIFPICFFTSYFCFFYTSNAQTNETVRAIEIENKKVKINFDTKTDVLYMPHQMHGRDYPINTSFLVDYDVQAFYKDDYTYPPFKHIVTRVAKLENCNYRKEYRTSQTGMSFQRYNRVGEDQPLCFIKYPENPVGKIVSLSRSYYEELLGNGIEQKGIFIESDDKEYALKYAIFRKWPLIPKFVFECTVDVRQEIFVGMFTLFIPPKVTKSCDFGFQRDRKKQFMIGASEQEAVSLLISRVLGLSPVPYVERLEKLDDVDLREIEERLISLRSPYIKNKN